MTERLISLFIKYPLDYISHIFLLLPVIIGFYRQKYLSNVLKGFVLFFIVRFSEENVLLYYSLNRMNSMGLQKVFMVVDVFLLIFFYYLLFKHRSGSLKVLFLLGGLIESALLIHLLLYSKTGVSGSIGRFFMITIALLYYNVILQENKIRNILYHSMFWINAGFLVYAMGTFMTSLFIDYLIDSTKISNNMFDLFWNMSQIIICIQCILTAIGMYFAKEERTNQLSSV